MPTVGRARGNTLWVGAVGVRFPSPYSRQQFLVEGREEVFIQANSSVGSAASTSSRSQDSKAHKQVKGFKPKQKLQRCHQSRQIPLDKLLKLRSCSLTQKTRVYGSEAHTCTLLQWVYQTPPIRKQCLVFGDMIVSCLSFSRSAATSSCHKKHSASPFSIPYTAKKQINLKIRP